MVISNICNKVRSNDISNYSFITCSSKMTHIVHRTLIWYIYMMINPSKISSPMETVQLNMHVIVYVIHLFCSDVMHALLFLSHLKLIYKVMILTYQY